MILDKDVICVYLQIHQPVLYTREMTVTDFDRTENGFNV